MFSSVFHCVDSRPEYSLRLEDREKILGDVVIAMGREAQISEPLSKILINSVNMPGPASSMERNRVILLSPFFLVDAEQIARSLEISEETLRQTAHLLTEEQLRTVADMIETYVSPNTPPTPLSESDLQNFLNRLLLHLNLEDPNTEINAQVFRFIVGHEFAHIELQHTLKQQKLDRGLERLTKIAAVCMTLYLTTFGVVIALHQDARFVLIYSLTVILGLSFLGILGIINRSAKPFFSKAQELEADAFAIKRFKGSDKGGLRLFSVCRWVFGDQWSMQQEFSGSHPFYWHRILHIEKKVALNFPDRLAMRLLMRMTCIENSDAFELSVSV